MNNQTQTHIPVNAQPAMPGSVLMNVGGALALILLIIAACAWVARRAGFARRLPAGNQLMSVVASHSLGQRERVIVVDMNGKRLLLGVTATQINCLATFDAPEVNGNTPAAGTPPTFQSTLMNLLKKRTVESPK